MVINNHGAIAGIVCKDCNKNELQLQNLGIAMNIPLETCNACLRKKAEKSTPSKPSKFEAQSAKFVGDINSRYAVLIDGINDGDDARDFMGSDEMAVEFLQLIRRAEKINTLKGKS